MEFLSLASLLGAEEMLNLASLISSIVAKDTNELWLVASSILRMMEKLAIFILVSTSTKRSF